MVARWALIAILLSVSIAGCVESAPPPTTNSDPETATTLSLHDCRGVFYGRMPEFSELGPWLPPGFKGADAGTFLKQLVVDAGVTGRALMVASGAFCAESERGWLAFWILVKEPRISGLESRGPDSLHWFEVAMYLENVTGIEAFGEQGIDVFPMEAVFAPDATPGYDGIVMEFLDNETSVLSMANIGFAQALTLDNPMSSWQVTENGTHELRMHLEATGNSGAGACTSDFAWVRNFLNSCTDGQALTGTIAQWEVEGEFLFHDGLHPR